MFLRAILSTVRSISILGRFGVFGGWPSASDHSKMCLLKRIRFFAALLQCAGQTVSHVEIDQAYIRS